MDMMSENKITSHYHYGLLWLLELQFKETVETCSSNLTSMQVSIEEATSMLMEQFHILLIKLQLSFLLVSFEEAT